MKNLQSKSEQDVKTFKIYTDLDLAIKKNLELKIIDYYINLIEKIGIIKILININMSNVRDLEIKKINKGNFYSFEKILLLISGKEKEEDLKLNNDEKI